jgi:asparagine synthase (glutamine-hydrolysing)
MCGIAGFYSPQETNNAVDILKKMLCQITHRGPDQSGIAISKEVGLGSVRLSIIDLLGGRMPLSNADNSLWIVFNGEIYNFLDLKHELEAKKHVFKTSSDTEVVLHLYQEYGVSFLNKLNGQFAIAIYDTKKKELFLARDRVGIKPLYYTNVEGKFIFASEMKALFEYPGVEAKISSKALMQVFTFWSVLSPNTIFKNVYEVPTGSYLKINSEGISKEKYWELPLCRPQDYHKIDIENSVEEYREIFSDAVKIRLNADVPVGAYLSGGIDSSVIASFIRKNKPGQLKTFSLAFLDKEFDESYFQKKASAYFKTNHKSISCDSKDISKVFEKVIWHAETPILRTAPAPMLLLSNLVKQNNLKVVLTGEGADELLGGYNIYKEAIIRQFWAKFPNSKYRPLLLQKLYPYIPQLRDSKFLKFFYSYKLKDVDSPIYSHLIRWKNTSRIMHYFSDDLNLEIKDYDPVSELKNTLSEKFSGIDLLDRAQWLEMNQFMSGYLLSSQGDRMLMANSIEGRYPFLDHRLIEFCMKLPPEHKIKILNEKYLLKKMMDGEVPKQILNRTKQAYRAPSISEFNSEKLGFMLSKEQIELAGIFSPEKVASLISKVSGKVTISELDNMAFLGILSTQILHYLFVQKKGDEWNRDYLENCEVILMNENRYVS